MKKFFKEFVTFLKNNKILIALPFVFVILIIILILCFGSEPTYAPFIYTVF